MLAQPTRKPGAHPAGSWTACARLAQAYSPC
jgi:hypothetical protein